MDLKLKVCQNSLFFTNGKHLRYGIALWGSTSVANMTRILRQQKKAVRVLANLSPLESCREAFKQLGIITVVALYVETVIILTTNLELDTGAQVHTYNTRHASKYILPHHRTSCYEKKTTYIGRKLHNHLPESLRRLQGHHMKRELHRWLLERPIYNLEEFYNLT